MTLQDHWDPPRCQATQTAKEPEAKGVTRALKLVCGNFHRSQRVFLTNARSIPHKLNQLEILIGTDISIAPHIFIFELCAAFPIFLCANSYKDKKVYYHDDGGIAASFVVSKVSSQVVHDIQHTDSWSPLRVERLALTGPRVIIRLLREIELCALSGRIRNCNVCWIDIVISCLTPFLDSSRCE